MPKKKTAPYLQCKPVSSSFFGGVAHYEWSEAIASEVNGAKEISGYLIRNLEEYYRRAFRVYNEEGYGKYQKILEKALTILDQNVRDYDPGNTFWSPTFKLSLESFELFDELEKLNLSSFVEELMRLIDPFLKKSSLIINFSEVYLVKKGEKAPPECRLGIDLCVSTIDEYAKHTDKLSYQIAKIIFNTYTTEAPRQQNSVLPRAKYPFVRNKSQLSQERFCALDIPLNQLVYFKSGPEANVFFQKNCKLFDNERSLIVGFDSETTPYDWLFISRLQRSNVNEVIIVLRGEHYLLPDERQKVYEQTLDLIRITRCAVLLQVILLPKETKENILTLAPNSLVQDGAFKALAQNAGYYLNAPDVFDRIFGYRPVHDVKSNFIATIKSEQQPEVPRQQHSMTYIYGEKETFDFRKSKQLSRKELKTKVALAMNLQQDVNQAQALTQNQVLSQAQELSQVVQEKQEIMHSSSWHWAAHINFKKMCDQFQVFAEDELQTRTRQAQLFHQIYLTQHYRQNYSQDYYLEQIATNELFRSKVVAKFFGLAFSKSAPVYLDNYSLDSIRGAFVTIFKEHFYLFIGDGLEPDASLALKSSFLGGRQLEYISNFYSAGFINPKGSLISSLGLLTEAYQDNLHYRLLLSNAPIVSEDQKQALISKAEALLSIFKIKTNLNSQQIREYEAHYLDFIKAFYSDCPQYVTILEKLFTLFDEHNIDNLRIMVQFLLSCTRWWALFELLEVLDSRCLLKNFYLIHFKYAPDVFSIAHLFDGITEHTRTDVASWHKKSNPFVELLESTPVVSSAKDWPLFEKFAHHYLVFAVKSGQPLTDNKLSSLKQLWQRLWVKFLIYSDSKEHEAKALMESLVTHLIAAEGFNLAPLKFATTFNKALERLIDHAIAHHTLKEQLAELGNISLLWTDVPYATAFNHFQVVCSEMQLLAEEINPVTRSYSVSLDELRSELQQAAPKASLTKTFFRYLGKERFREELAFYRELYGKMCSPAPDFIQELLFGYYISVTTGIHYGININQKQFIADFLLLLKVRKEPVTKEVVLKIIATFFSQLSQLKAGKGAEGSLTLWSLWRENNCFALIDQAQPIPAILGQKFERKQLKLFILKNAKAITNSLALLRQDQTLAYILLKNWFAKGPAADFEVTSLILLQTFYPKLSMKIFMGDLLKIAQFMETYALLVQRGARDNVLGALNKMGNKKVDMAQLLSLVELISEEMADAIDNNERDILSAQFLKALAGTDSFFANSALLKPAFSIILNYYLRVNIKDVSLPYLFSLVDTLIPLGGKRTTDVLQVLLKSMKTIEAYQFFSKSPQLSQNELVDIASIIQCIDSLSVTIPFLDLCVKNNSKNSSTVAKNPMPRDDRRLLNLPEKPRDAEMRRDLPDRMSVNAGNYFGYIANLLFPLNAEQGRDLISIATIICSDSQLSILDTLLKLKKIPLDQLKQLMHLYDLYALKKEDFLALIDSPSLTEALAQFERVKHTQNRERHHYNSEEVAKKIAQIKHRSPTEGDQVISLQEQEELLKDYKQVMSFMADKPVLIERNKQGNQQKFAIYELKEEQFQLLFKRLQEQIKTGVRAHEYQLMLLALCCEALYRTTNKFPRSTQILNVLNTLHYKGNLIHEVQTGEGKSIIAALHGALLADGIRNVDIVTENNHLAWEGVHKFKHFYAYLGIPCAKSIIEAHSSYSTYIQPGINYSTASSLALFRTGMRLAKKDISTNVVLICDEIDATLTTLVQFRLAESLDPKLNDLQSWSPIYSSVLAFVKDSKLFLTNKCTKDEDATNLRTYVQLTNPNEKITRFVKELNNDVLSVLIESALVAHELEENVDYMVQTKTGKQTYSYAAPILASNKRPDSRVSYSVWVQQLLHTLLNNQKPAPKYAFQVEPNTDTVIAVTAKNFFDFYRVGGGCIIGLTGTGGSSVELEEFYRLHGLVVFNYPTYYNNLCRDLGFFTAFGAEKHLELILEKIKEHKNSAPSQPILIITSSPQETLTIRNYLAAHAKWSLQTYGGYEADGLSEAKVIQLAGQEHMITIANESLARGADIAPNHPDGLAVINVGTDLTESSLRQIKGRAARNNKPGVFCSIIDASAFGEQQDPEVNIALLFQAHQRNLSLIQQKQRAKSRLLEESRHLIVGEYLLKLREKVDKILSKQGGLHCVLVGNQKLKNSLSDFNKRAERHYTELLEKHQIIEGDVATEFLAARVSDYEKILTSWLPEDRFKNFKPIEPIIPLEHLQGINSLESLPIESLTILSQLFAEGWKFAGHQNMPRHFATLDKFLEEFKPYFDKEHSLQYCIGQYSLRKGFVEAPAVTLLFDNVKKVLIEFIKEAENVPVAGYLVPKDRLIAFVTNYLETTKTQINERKWDDVTYPAIDFTAINLWITRVNSVLSAGTFVFGGPIPFVMNKFVIPALISWATTFFNSQFAKSDSSIIQVLMGLTNITSDLSNALSAIAALSAEQPMTLGLFIDKIGPLLQNQALMKVVVKFLELNDQKHLIPYVQAIPEFLTALKPYRDCQFRELFTVEVLLRIFKEACQFELVTKNVAGTPWEGLLKRISQLNAEFLSGIGKLSFVEFLKLTKVIAHPNFCEFLEKLPQGTTFAQVVDWLDAPSGELPIEVKEVFEELRTYLANRSAIEENNHRVLIALQEEFSLTTNKLKANLSALAPVFRERIKAPLPVIAPTIAAETPWLTYAGYALSATFLVLCNVFFFSALVLLASLLMTAWLAYPFINPQVDSLGDAESDDPDLEEEQDLEPIIIDSSDSGLTLASTIGSEPGFAAGNKEGTSPSKKKDAYAHYGLFKPQESEAAGGVQNVQARLGS